MTREKMDWRGHGGFFSRNSAGELIPTDAEGVPLPLDEDGYLLAPNPTHSPFGPTPPVPPDPVVTAAPVVTPTPEEEE